MKFIIKEKNSFEHTNLQFTVNQRQQGHNTIQIILIFG